MRVLILTLNYAPEEIGIGPYSTGTAEALAAAGHQVRVVAGKPYYPQWRTYDGHRGLGYARDRAGPVDIVRCPHYVPARPSGAKRIVHHLSFAASALMPALAAARTFRPDVVFAVAPSLLAAPVARAAAKISGAASWLHIQDFEVEAALATGLMAKDGMAARAAFAFQRRTIGAFDMVSTISPQMCAKLADLGIPPERIVEFRNWTDLNRISVQAEPSSYGEQWGIGDRHVALYSGNIANKQGIDIVLDAARIMKDRNDLLFVICGDGPNRAQLIKQAGDLPNIRFHDLQPAERLGELLGLASVHLLPQLAGAADLVLPSKLTNMLASCRPVVATALPGTGLFEEVDGCGIVVPPADAAAFAGAIGRLIDTPGLMLQLGAAARERAEQRWSQDQILSGLVERLEALTGSKPAR